MPLKDQESNIQISGAVRASCMHYLPNLEKARELKYSSLVGIEARSPIHEELELFDDEFLTEGMLPAKFHNLFYRILILRGKFPRELDDRHKIIFEGMSNVYKKKGGLKDADTHIQDIPCQVPVLCKDIVDTS